MTTERIIRVNELLRREVGEALFRLLAESGGDLAAVTVTGVTASRDLQHARVMVSIRADPPQQEHLLRLIRTHRATIQEGINRHLRLRYTPRLTFHLDPSLAEGDRLLHLLSSLEAEAPPEEE